MRRQCPGPMGSILVAGRAGDPQESTTPSLGWGPWTCRQFGRSLLGAGLAMLVLLLGLPSQGWSQTHDWSLRFGDTGEDEGGAVEVDAAGNLLMAGSFAGTTDLGGGPLTSLGESDIVLAKYDSTGAHIWSQNFGGTLSDFGFAVAADSSGNVYLAGVIRGTADLGGGPLISAGLSDIVLAKYDANGVHQWSQRYGDTGFDAAVTLSVDSGGNVVVGGLFNNAVDFGGGPITGTVGPNGGVGFLAKYDPSGSHLWSFTVPAANAIDIDGSNNVVAIGAIEPSPGNIDLWLGKFTSSGDSLWVQQFGGVGLDRGLGVAFDGAGNVIVSGLLSDTADFGGGPMTSFGGQDALLAKYDPSGAHLWSQHFGGTSNDRFQAVDANSSGNIVAGGRFQGTGDFGGGDLTSAGSDDIVLAAYDAGGGPTWSQRYGDTGEDRILAGCVVVEDSWGVAMSGRFSGAVDFGGGFFNSAGTRDGFLAKYTEPLPQFQEGDLFYPFCTPGGSGIARLTPNDATYTLVSGLAGIGKEFAYDPHRQALIYKANGDLYLMDAAANATLMPSVYNVQLLAPTGTGKIYFMDGALSRWRYLDETNTAQDLYDTDGTTPFVTDPNTGREHAIYDPTTNSLIRFYSGFGGNPCATTGTICIIRTGLSPDGTRVSGVSDTTSTFVHASNVEVVGARHLPSTEILFGININATGDPLPRLQMLDPVTMTLSTYATFGNAEFWGSGTLAGMTYSTVRDKPVLSSWWLGEVACADSTGAKTVLVAGSCISSSPIVEIGPLIPGTPLGVEDTGVGKRPAPTIVMSAYPNPFRSRSSIQFRLTGQEVVNLTIYDASGRRIRTLLEGASYSAGVHQVPWDGKDRAGRAVASGAYFFRLKTPGATAGGRVVLIR